MNNQNNNTKQKSRKSFSQWWRETLLDWEKAQMVATFFIIIIIATTPLYIKQPYLMGIVVLTVIYSYVGLTWNIVSGFTGQILIGHLIFFATGSYTTIMLYNILGISPWLGLIASAFTAGLLGLLVSLITLRYGLKKDYFALFTIALLVAFRPLISKWRLAGGSSGIGVRFTGVSLQNMIFVEKTPYLFIGLVLLIIAVFIQYFIYRSKMGKYFLAIREDEDAAASLGVNTSLYKTINLLISSSMAGIGGGFYIMYITFIDPPQIFHLGVNVEIAIVAPLIGGLGTLLGPIIGAALNKPFVDLTRIWFIGQAAGISLVVYGLFLIIFILFLPKGITNWIRHGPYVKLCRYLTEKQNKEEAS